MFDQNPNSVVANGVDYQMTTHFGAVMFHDRSRPVLEFKIGQPATITIASGKGKLGNLEYEGGQWTMYHSSIRTRTPLGTSSSMTAIRLAAEKLLSDIAH
ncbi:MAG: hypothetical protein NVS3B3_04480 [Aquirhabdus sp.]